MASFSTLANLYGVSIDTIKEIGEQCRFRPWTVNVEIPEAKAEEIRGELERRGYTPSNSSDGDDMRKQLEQMKKRLAGVSGEDNKKLEEQKKLEEEKRKAEQARLEAERRKAEQARLEAERRKAEQERLEAEKRKAEQERNRAERANQAQYKNEEERRRLLSSDYIIFTLTALEKQGTKDILADILKYKMANVNPKVKLLVVSEAIEQLRKDAASDTDKEYLRLNYEIFNKLRSFSLIVELDGTIAEEGLVIDKYLRENTNDSTRILILGKNMTLNTCVYIKNESNKIKNPDGKGYRYKTGYVPIEERSVTNSGKMPVIHTHSSHPVFGPVTGKDHLAAIDERGNVSIYFSNNAEERISDKHYRVVVKTTDLKETRLAVTGGIPAVGDEVYMIKKGEKVPLKLENMLHSGGREGIIYSIGIDDVCAKIFAAESITARKMAKLKILCNNYELLRARDNSLIRRIAWPQEMLYNSAGEPVGYIMRFFRDVRGFDTIPARKYVQFIENSKEKEIIAAVSLTELVRFLHENNVILSDMNMGNILFDSNQRAYLVDLDSAQITDPKPFEVDSAKRVVYCSCYPANVAYPQFLSPEHIYEKEYTFVHSKADDVWCLQHMIFMLLTMCGAYFPYANSAESDEGKKDIKEGRYKYMMSYREGHAIDSSSNQAMHCIISRLSHSLRREFFNAFSGSGRNFKEDTRREAQVWMRWLVGYYYELPDMIADDTENGVFMPKSIKYDKAQATSVRPSRSSISNGRDVNAFLNNFFGSIDPNMRK